MSAGSPKQTLATVLARPRAAIAVGAFVIFAELCRHFDAISGLPASWLSLPIPDWIAGTLLVVAGFKAQRDYDGHTTLLVAGWSFMLSLLVTAFFGHLEDWGTATDDKRMERAVVAIIAMLTLLSLGGLIGTLRTREHRFTSLD